MGQIDALDIRNPDMNGDVVAVIERPQGPIEREHYVVAEDGTHIPVISSEEEVVQVAGGFGIDATTGEAYFDTDGAAPGEAVVLRVIPSSQTIIFDTEG